MRSNPLLGEGNSIPKLQKLREDYTSYVNENKFPSLMAKKSRKVQNNMIGGGRTLGGGISPNVPMSRSHARNDLKSTNSSFTLKKSSLK